MPRIPRVDIAGYPYHVINRAIGRAKIFESMGDYAAFLRVLIEAKEKVPVRLYAFCVMPNHWHLVLEPLRDGDIGRFMQWLKITHTSRWYGYRDQPGLGHLYQGRYKSFPVETDEYFTTLCRYVERNPLRAGLVQRAEDWRWSSLWIRTCGTDGERRLLDPWPVPPVDDYLDFVNEPMPHEEDSSGAIRQCIKRSKPYGSSAWQTSTARALGIESVLKDFGRPKRKK